jgi:hypothetical protein
MFSVNTPFPKEPDEPFYRIVWILDTDLPMLVNPYEYQDLLDGYNDYYDYEDAVYSPDDYPRCE